MGVIKIKKRGTDIEIRYYVGNGKKALLTHVANVAANDKPAVEAELTKTLSRLRVPNRP